MKKVILEGCNGDWAQKRYLPFLVEKAAKEEIELWAVDIKDKIKLGSIQVEEDWRVARSKNRACYLNKSKDTQTYGELSNANYIFIITPDQFHSKIARGWLDGLAPGGRIFIEKPLDASVRSALRLRGKIEEKKGEEAVFAFDHYLANVYPFLREKTPYLEEIGEVKRIEFHLLEPSGILPEREKALDKGMILDLLCHVLAVVCAVFNRNLTYSATKLPAVKLEKVKAAQYAGCPISGETFALTKFMVNHDIEAVSVVGKGVGTSEDKFMRLYGSNGGIKLDFVDNEFSVFDSQGRQRKQGRLNSKHVGSFLEEVLPGKKHPLLVPGVLSFDAALEILTILDEARKQVDRMPEYRCNESISQILGRF